MSLIKTCNEAEQRVIELRQQAVRLQEEIDVARRKLNKIESAKPDMANEGFENFARALLCISIAYAYLSSTWEIDADWSYNDYMLAIKDYRVSLAELKHRFPISTDFWDHMERIIDTKGWARESYFRQRRKEKGI